MNERTLPAMGTAELTAEKTSAPRWAAFFLGVGVFLAVVGLALAAQAVWSAQFYAGYRTDLAMLTLLALRLIGGLVALTGGLLLAAVSRLLK